MLNVFLYVFYDLSKKMPTVRLTPLISALKKRKKKWKKHVVIDVIQIKHRKVEIENYFFIFLMCQRIMKVWMFDLWSSFSVFFFSRREKN